jgi:formamidopyrimidine-DNA glycosylase
MPELPELSVIQEVLSRRITGQAIESAEVFAPGGAIVVRDLTGEGFGLALAGQRIERIFRRGKFLVFELAPGSSANGDRSSPTAQADAPTAPDVFLVINPKLSGRLQLCEPKAKKAGPVLAVLHLSSGLQLRYIDRKKMGQVFVTRQPPEQAPIADYAGMGPEALEVSLEEFKERLRPFRGEIKGVLVRSACVAGIGNAWADEILWEARIHPYRKRTALKPEEIERLYHAMRQVLLAGIETLRAQMGENVQLEPRDFMAVHLKTGQPCPRCGTSISLVGANQRITNFCRTCQPGGLIRGM